MTFPLDILDPNMTTAPALVSFTDCTTDPITTAQLDENSPAFSIFTFAYEASLALVVLNEIFIIHLIFGIQSKGFLAR
jgi:hypothetical protein